MANPKSITIFQSGDRVGLIGDDQEIEQAKKIMHSSGESHVEFEELNDHSGSASRGSVALDR